MRLTLQLAAALVLAAAPASAEPLVLNGQLATSDFSGGVGDRMGTSGDEIYYGSNYYLPRNNGFRPHRFSFPQHHMGHSHGGGHR